VKKAVGGGTPPAQPPLISTDAELQRGAEVSVDFGADGDFDDLGLAPRLHDLLH
jgi:hypothetical protein